MELELSRDSTTNTVLRIPGGRPLYHIHTPSMFSRTTTIYKIPETNVQRYEDAEKMTDVEPKAEEEMARIYWHTISSSRLIYDGRALEFKTFLKSKGFRGDRVFIGPDGKNYKWHEGWNGPRLELADGSKPAKTVAKLRQGNFFTGRKAVLEIDPSVDHMRDLVVITFVFIETRRRERELQQAAAA
ncbi:unnamed protein product [Somion occarium]|uniref:DUF6593 domain-containing protein n=1 Tax=Somion occarium TaxID=3059160 RepID=A0ABP1D5J7_9APHY